MGDDPLNLKCAGQRAAGKAESVVRKAATPLRNYGFPYRAPTVPKGVEVPREPSKLGANYDTEWARTPSPRRRGP
jgi:1-acyl-sn-glycerol-3-phosphate acyltransferase